MPEADGIVVVVTELEDVGTSTTILAPPSLGEDPLPSPPPSPDIRSETEVDDILKTNSLSELAEDDIQYNGGYPSDGSIARANTVTSYGKAEAVHEGLDVPACISRLRTDLWEEQKWEKREESDDEEDHDRQDDGKEEERERIKEMWKGKERAVKGGEQSLPTKVIPEALDPEWSESELKSKAASLLDSSTHPATYGKGVTVKFVPTSAESAEPRGLVPPKFEWGTGPAPGEEKRFSKKTRSKRTKGLRFFCF